jgi:protein-tyrosine phosphatase
LVSTYVPFYLDFVGQLFYIENVKNIVFICTGNLCRSPLAEAILKKKLGERGTDEFAANSAGIHSLSGEPAAELAVRVAARRGVSLSSHVARQVTRSMLEGASLVIVMESYHLQECRAILGNAERKCHLLTDFGPPEIRGRDIRDPYG